MVQNESNDTVKQEYLWILNEKIAEIRMLKASATGDMHRFKRYSEYVYGKPSKDIFAYTINSIRDKAEEQVTSENPDIAQAAQNLLSALPKMDKPETTELPDESTIVDVRSRMLKSYDNIINIPEIPKDKTEFNADQIKKAFEGALKNIGDEDGWKITIDPETSSRKSISVSQEKKEVIIPPKRNVNRDKLIGLIVHEIGTHVTRNINGEKSALKLLSLGLRNYLPGEEGISTMGEQVINNDVEDFRGIDGYLAIGLAIGTDGQPRNFRQVYSILESYYTFNNLLSSKDLTESHSKAQDTAWNRSVRTFRGTSCEKPGACFSKDIAYRRGNVGTWKVAQDNPDEMDRFQVGKYDPSNPRHIQTLNKLGITGLSSYKRSNK